MCPGEYLDVALLRRDLRGPIQGGNRLVEPAQVEQELRSKPGEVRQRADHVPQPALDTRIAARKPDRPLDSLQAIREPPAQEQSVRQAGISPELCPDVTTTISHGNGLRAQLHVLGHLPGLAQE